MSRPLTTGTPWKGMVLFAIPLLLGNIVQQLYHFTDAVVVGRVLGSEALAAVGASNSLIMTIIGFAWGMSSGFGVPVARAFGAGDMRALRLSVATGALITAAGSVLLGAGGFLAARPLLELLNTPVAIIDDSAAFMRVTFAGVAGIMASNFVAAIMRAIGDSRTPLIFLVVASCLNLGLVVVTVGVLRLGVGGAALATACAQAVAVLLCLAYIARRVPVLRVRREDWRVDRGLVVEHLRLGLPLGLQMSIIAIGSVAVQTRLNELGPDAVAAFTSAMRVDFFAVTMLSSLGLAVTTFVAQNLGAGRIDRARAGVRQALITATAAAVVFGIVILLFGDVFVRAFFGDGSDVIVATSATGLRLNAACYIVLGVLFVLRNALVGMSHTTVPTISGFVELGVRLFTAVVLGGAFGYLGIVWGTPLAWAGSVLLLIPAYVVAQRRLAVRAPSAAGGASGEVREHRATSSCAAAPCD